MSLQEIHVYYKVQIHSLCTTKWLLMQFYPFEGHCILLCHTGLVARMSVFTKTNSRCSNTATIVQSSRPQTPSELVLFSFSPVRLWRFDEASEDEYNIQDHTSYGHMARGIPGIKSTSTAVRAHLLHGHGI